MDDAELIGRARLVCGFLYAHARLRDIVAVETLVRRLEAARTPGPTEAPGDTGRLLGLATRRVHELEAELDALKRARTPGPAAVALAAKLRAEMEAELGHYPDPDPPDDLSVSCYLGLGTIRAFLAEHEAASRDG